MIVPVVMPCAKDGDLINLRKFGPPEDQDVSQFIASLRSRQKRGIGAVALLAGWFCLGPVALHSASSTNTPPASAPSAIVDGGIGHLGLVAFEPNPGQPLENSLGMKFVAVTGVTVLFSIWDTRVQDYEKFVQSTQRQWNKPEFAQGAPHPAVNVSWDDAQAFCTWLTATEQAAGRLRPNQKYRLPTDAEWSVAVGLNEPRSGPPQSKLKQLIFPWDMPAGQPSSTARNLQAAGMELLDTEKGLVWPPPKGAGNYSARLGVDDFKETSPVGSFTANKSGLYDMGGNVRQCCEDYYDDVFDDRVLRGSLYSSSTAAEILSSNRDKDEPGSSWRGDTGFRCVIAVESASEPRSENSAPAFPNGDDMHRAIMSNLRRLSDTCDQYFLESGKTEATFAQLEQFRIGGSLAEWDRLRDRGKYAGIRPVLGEDYTKIKFKQGEPLRLRLPDGRELSYDQFK